MDRLVRLMPRGRGRPPVFNRDEIHKYLWSRVDGDGLVEVVQSRISEGLGCAPRTVRDILADLEDEGKIERIDRPGIIRLYRVNEPDPTPTKAKAKKRTTPTKAKNRTIVWG